MHLSGNRRKLGGQIENEACQIQGKNSVPEAHLAIHKWLCLNFVFNFFYVPEYFTSMYLCVLHAYLMPKEARRGHQNTWNYG